MAINRIKRRYSLLPFKLYNVLLIISLITVNMGKGSQALIGATSSVNYAEHNPRSLQSESLACSTQSGFEGLTVDNTISNGGSEGCFVSISSSSPKLLEVIIQVENKHEFWKQITVPYNLNDDRIEPINVWAKVGFIAPDSYAEYKLLLDTNDNSNIQFFVNAARSDDGIPRAGVLNMATKLLKIATGEDWINEQLDPDAFIEVLDIVTNSTDLVSAADALTRFDLDGFSRAMYGMVNDDDDIVDILEAVAARLGKSITKSVLEKIFVVVKIVLLLKDIWHVVWSMATGSYVGTVSFINKVNSSPLPIAPVKVPVSAPPPSSPVTLDAQFTGIESPTDNTVVSPNQAIHKSWRVKNTGNRIWGLDHKLVFTGGNQMGAPNAVNIPLTEPGGIADISLDITAPSTGGTHRGEWQLRNPQGTFFGDKLWVQIVVPETNNPQPPNASTMQLICTNCPTTIAPGQSFRPTVRVSGSVLLLQSRGDMLRNTDGNRYGAYEFVAVNGTVNQGQDYDFTFYEQNPITVPNSEGVYESKWRVWQNGGWVGPELTIRFEVKTGAGTNHPPSAPALTGPGDWAVYTGNGGINLQAQHNSDPDGDAVTQYYFEIFESAQNANSGWISSNSWSPQGLGYNGYQWRVKVRDSRGAESGWSPQVWHFTVQTNEPQIYEFYPTQCHEPWGNPEQYCFCARTNAGTLRLQVNSATDSSDRGAWQVLNELGTTNYDCKSDNDRPPTWTQLEYETGTHLVRLYARRDGGWAAAASSDRTIYLPPERRPNAPHETAPRNFSYVNSRTVTLDWRDTLRTTGYRLQASNDPQWGSLLLDQSLPADVSQYTHTFVEEYAKVYWRVIATGPYGTNEASEEFYIDTTPPTSAVSPLSAVTTDTKFNVDWSGSDARAGLRWYHIQVRDGKRTDSQWSDWLVNTTKSGEVFAGQPGHTYYFRARAMDQVGNWEEWPSGEGNAYTVVNPAAAPLTAWWNNAYAHKRNLIIRNNDSDVMPAHYPIHLHFDDTTSPTAAEVYNGSTATTKGDDLRIVYDNQAELNRFVQRFTPSTIDLWFPLQAGLGGGESNNGGYQLYYGNAGADSPQPTINTIFLPEADGNTLGLWHFQEGSGDTVYDSSGRSHHSSLSNGSWVDGYLGNAVSFNGVNTTLSPGNHSDFNNGGAITLEAWIYPTRRSWGMVFMKGVNGSGHYRLNLTGDGNVEFVIAVQGGEHSIVGSTNLQANQWYHVAGVHDGGNSMWIYVNGVQEREKSDAAPFIGRDYPLYIGNAPWWNGMAFAGLIQHARISNVARRDFPYARIDITPSVVAGAPLVPPVPGTPDLVVLGLNTYPNPDGGVIVEALVQNQGNRETQNGFYTDLYIDHLPTGAGDYTGSAQFWVNSPIAAGATVTLTTVITDFNGGAVVAAQSQTPAAETIHTLYMQTDSAGVVPDANKANNILSSGVEVCLANPDAFEGDNAVAQAATLTINQVQSHNFSSAGDQDWVKFSAEGGKEYTFSTRNLGAAADTYLYLYDTDGTTLLLTNDDTEDTLASQIKWIAPATGVYFLLVRHWNPNVAGCGASYELLWETVQAEATCFDKIPAQGITLFTEPTCAGEAKNFSTLGWLSLSNTEFNDNVSSITVAVGQSAEIFDNDSEETGLARCITEWKWDLAKDHYFGTETAIDNRITSIKLYADSTCGKQFPVDAARCDAFTYDGVVLFDYMLCGGRELAINQPSEHQLAASQFDNLTGSIYIGDGWSMIVYAEADFQGESTCLNWGPLWYLTADAYSQGGSSMYNTISSVKIFHDRTCGATQPAAPKLYLPIVVNQKASNTPATGVTVSGIVYHSTTPLPNVKVDLIPGDVSNPPLASTNTNAEGKFVFTQVPPGNYSLKRYGPTSDYINWNGSSLQVQSTAVVIMLDLPKRMTLVSPSTGTMVNTTTPTFCWQPLPTATKYTFQLNQSASWALIEQINGLTATCYTTPATLQRNTQHTWQIDAYDGLGRWVGSTDNAFTLIVK